MWIKVCGMTSPEAVEAALAAGVDAVGFVFATSVRRVAPARARELAEPARGRVACVAVTQHPEPRLLQEILAVFEPDLLQTDALDLAAVAPGALRCGVLPVVRSGAALPQPLPARLLFEGPVSGTGETADWARARELAGRTELVLAGGLRPANVAAAIGRVRPYGVDVSSGVESQPGVKSPALILEFVEAARAAFLEHER
jgi:phosphoribosylanthranilate isomerase